MRSDAQALKGHLDVLLLATLEDGPRHGYAVKEALSVEHEGTPLVDLVGGYGVAMAVTTALERLGGSTRGARVAVQGFGSMGGSAAHFLARLGAVVARTPDTTAVRPATIWTTSNM